MELLATVYEHNYAADPLCQHNNVKTKDGLSFSLFAH